MNELEKLFYMVDCAFKSQHNMPILAYYDKVLPYYDDDNNLSGLESGDYTEQGDLKTHKMSKLDILFDYFTMGMVYPNV